jgi:hypothetical protein
LGNQDYFVTNILVDKTKRKNVTGIIKEQYITVAAKQNGTFAERLQLCYITFKTDEGKVYVVKINNFYLLSS